MAQPIPFTNQQASGLEPLGGAGGVAFNVVQDSTGAVTRRPGIRSYSVAPAGVVDEGGIGGLFATDDGVLLAVSNGVRRNVYEVSRGTARKLALPLLGLKRPTFAQTEMLVAVAGGSHMLKYVRADRSVDELGGSPPQASHVIAHALRLLSNDMVVDRTKVRYSAPAIGTTDYSGLEDWSFTTPAGYVTAESRPDPVVALAETTNEVFVFGTSTLQLFAPDASAVYLPTSTLEVGCSAPSSVIRQDGGFAWLDQYRRIVLSDGRSVKFLSGPISRDLDGMTSVSDCFGFRVMQNDIDCLVWSFPTDGRTFVYQVGSGWGQWSGFSLAKAHYTPLVIRSHVLRQDTNVNVVGTADGHIGELTTATRTDLGEPIRAHVETGYITRGTDQKKHCQCVRLALRRGSTAGSTSPVAFLSYRDRPGPWEGSIPVYLGASGDTEPVLEFRSLGTYRRRQWRFEFTGPEELVLVSASEDFEVLEQ